MKIFSALVSGIAVKGVLAVTAEGADSHSAALLFRRCKQQLSRTHTTLHRSTNESQIFTIR